MTTEQREIHDQFITGSKVASILALPGAFVSKFSLFARMTGYEAWPELDDPRLRAGTYAELMIAEWCRMEYGWKLVDGPEGGAFHPQYPFIYGLVDRILIENGRNLAVVEFKNVDFFMSKEWVDGTPDKYLAQVYLYMMIHNLPGWIVACFGGNRFERYEITRNAEIEDYILQECIKFWDDLKTEKWPVPDMGRTTGDTIRHLYANPNEKILPGSWEDFSLAKRYDSFNRAGKRIEAYREEYANILKNRIGDNIGMVFPDGSSRAMWKQSGNGRRLSVQIGK